MIEYKGYYINDVPGLLVAIFKPNANGTMKRVTEGGRKRLDNGKLLLNFPSVNTAKEHIDSLVEVISN